MLDALNNWRLPGKMFAGFAPVALILASLGGMAIVSSRSVGAAVQGEAAHSLPTASSLAALLGDLRDTRILTAAHVDATTVEEAAVTRQRIGEAEAGIDREIAHLSAVADPAFAPDIARLKRDIATLADVAGRVVVSAQRPEALALLDGEGRRAMQAATSEGDALMRRVVAHAAAADDKALADAGATASLMLAIALLAIGLLALVWQLLGRSLAAPMDELAMVTVALAEGRDVTVPYCERNDELGAVARGIERMHVAAAEEHELFHKHGEDRRIVIATLGGCLAALAKGDLTAEVKAGFPEAAAALKLHFNDAIANLRSMIGSVSESAAGIRTGSGEIAQAAEDLARRTESNAASLEQTSAALAQIDDRLKATARAASRTVDRADKAIATVKGGRSIADEAVQAMERVRTSATGIDSVIEGLDKIAFQTRVLAMNAAVEAGRAGDAGRGFAVVADLVSSLAMRAEEEAKLARDQLTLTQTDIVIAVGAVERVDGALADIAGDVGEVHALIGGMATDNQAQSAAITQISAAVASMDQSTQQNAAMVEQTSAAARHLTGEVTALAEQAALFRVESGSRPRMADKKPLVRAGASRGYVSLVQPLPVAAAVVDRGGEDWSDF